MGTKSKMDFPMTDVYMTYGSLITPIGSDAESTFQAMLNGELGVKTTKNSGFNGEDWPLGKIDTLPDNDRYDALLKLTCTKIIDSHGLALCNDSKTIVIISSTKADISALPSDCFASTRKIVQNIFELKNNPVIISNACISGVLAINTAADYLQLDKYDTAIVIGIDTLSDFIVYGFQSLFALSKDSSKPFDKHRTGISIGEAAGSVILTKKKTDPSKFYVKYLGGSSSNDANHISGPSRTGEGLFRSVNKTLERADIPSSLIDFISAHGTGTNYNDEMESIAFNRLELSNVPLNSFKGYFGHTLGAAGIIEVIGTMKMMEHNTLLKSPGYKEKGTSHPLNVISSNKTQEINISLKTASGFGGGNGSLLIGKEK